MKTRKSKGNITLEDPFDAAAYLESIQPAQQLIKKAKPRCSDEELVPLVKELRDWCGKPASDIPQKFKAVFEHDFALSLLYGLWETHNVQKTIDGWLYGHDSDREGERFVSRCDVTLNARTWLDI